MVNLPEKNGSQANIFSHFFITRYSAARILRQRQLFFNGIAMEMKFSSEALHFILI